MTARNTTIRDRHRRAIARDRPPCALCGDEIDYTLRYDVNARGARIPHPLSFTVDHIEPLNKGGADTIENKQAAHWLCNRLKSDKLDGETAGGARVFVTSRVW